MLADLPEGETVATLNAAIAAMTQQIADAVLADLPEGETVATLNAAIAAMTQQITDAVLADLPEGETVATLNAAIADLTQQITDAVLADLPEGETVATLNATIADLAQQIVDLNQEITDLKQEIVDLRGQITNPIEAAQRMAAVAATAAEDAATAAEDHATEAENVAMGRALFQTAPNAQENAEKARTHAGLARTDATAARAAANKAAEAEDVAAALAARLEAEGLRDSATSHGEMADQYGTAAVMGAVNEVKVVDGGHQLGDTTIMTDVGANVVTVNDQTTRTGLLANGMQPKHTVDMVGEQDFEANTAPDADTAYRQAVAARTFDIGKVIDSSDDTARLMLVTHYAGSKMVNVYAYSEAEEAGDRLTGRMVGTNRIQTDGDDTPNVATDDVFVTLRSVGTYYLAGGADDTNGLAAADVVGAMAEAKHVYSYLSAGAATTDDATDDVTSYVVLQTTSTTDGVTTLTYRRVDIDAVASDDVADGTANTDIDDQLGVDGGKQIAVRLPDATAYKHINFGVWAALGEAALNGEQDVAGLGIGFVSSIGDGMTGADMPNNGDATYNGDWVATVRKADLDGNGAISLEHGPASITADFGDGDFTAILTGLATLTGEIAGNTFAGTKADTTGNRVGLTGGADFTGAFNGGFFGSKAAEAGGVFSFDSEDNDNEDGEFAGAFGGDRN